MDVGRRPYGNSWLDTHGRYPQYRAREGRIQTLAARVNACLTHNMQGKPLPPESNEMLAILMYFKWVGRGRPSLEKDADDRLPPLKFLARAADPTRGATVFAARCARCHGQDGAGQLLAEGKLYLYPPLFGDESFSTGSSMSRLSVIARFVKGNMPKGENERSPLSDSDAWDVSAFVLSRPRPGWPGGTAFPHLEEKPYDFPIPPYADKFSEVQHRRGPFEPIIDYWSKKGGNASVADPSGI
jgi:thiosulfate dehydrogenase